MLGILLLTLAQAEVPRQSPHQNHTRENRRMGRNSSLSLAFFEFAPASGLGMTETCACTTPTGAKGEALTFTRTGNATCSKQGLATTGIANGDLVVCSGNQPRVELDSDGVRGLRVEGARTNVVVRSQDIDNAAWTSGGLGAAGPTVNADAATAPDGTLTAERMQYAATTAGQLSYTLQAPFSAVATSASVYIKGFSGSGTLDLCIQSGASTYSCSACDYVSASWSRCLRENVTAFAGGRIVIGNLTAYTGGVVRAANDVFVWGAQGEAGAYATSYIPTAGAAATRNAEAAYFDMGSAVLPAANVGSISVSVSSNSTTKSNNYPTPIEASAAYPSPAAGTNRLTLYSSNTSGSTYQCFAGNSTPTLYSTGAVAGAASFRAWCSAGSTVNGALNTAMSESGATAGSFAAQRYIMLGNSGGLYHQDAVISRACRDPSPDRCR
jgi:hypothetical protein